MSRSEFVDTLGVMSIEISTDDLLTHVYTHVTGGGGGGTRMLSTRRRRLTDLSADLSPNKLDFHTAVTLIRCQFDNPNAVCLFDFLRTVAE